MERFMEKLTIYNCYTVCCVDTQRERLCDYTDFWYLSFYISFCRGVFKKCVLCDLDIIKDLNGITFSYHDQFM